MPRLVFATLAVCSLFGCDAADFTVDFGFGHANQICIRFCCSDVYECALDAGNHGNRLNADGALGHHTFSIGIFTRDFGGGAIASDICARRTDQNSSWEMDLHVNCRVLAPADQGCPSFGSSAEECCQHYDAATGTQPCVTDGDGSCSVVRPPQTVLGSCPARMATEDRTTCYWVVNTDRFSHNYARGNATRLGLEEAKLGCFQLGTDCSAVTCAADSSSCTMRESPLLETSPVSETTYTKACRPCSWSEELIGRFSRYYADDVSDKFSLIDAQSKCVEMGPLCRAVTCQGHGSCTVRGSSTLEGSPSGETTFLKECRFPPGYVVAHRRLSRQAAFDYCSGIGSSLVEPPTSHTTYDNIRSVLRPGDPVGVWLGIRLDTTLDRWVRGDGRRVLFGNTLWEGPGVFVPTNHSRPYAAMVFLHDTSGRGSVVWRDFPADVLNYVVCNPLPVR